MGEDVNVSFESKDVEVLHEHAISFKSGEKHDPGNAFFTTSVAVPALFGSHGRRTAELINKPYSDFSIDTTSYMNYPSEYVKTLVLVNKDENEIKDFKPGTRKAIPNLISEWEISDMFEENEIVLLSVIN